MTLTRLTFTLKAENKRMRRENGNYVKGKEAGITGSVIPKHYSTGPRNVKFSILCVFKTKLQLKEDKNEKESKEKKLTKDDEKNKEVIDAELPYILDFDLGLAKTPNLAQPMSSLPNISESKEVNDAQSKPSHKSRKSNEN